MIPTIDAFKCDGCGVCVTKCPPQVMGTVNGIAVIITDLCEECGICNDTCPQDAIRFSLPEKHLDQVFESYNTPR